MNELRILLIDDDPIFCFLFTRIIHNQIDVPHTLQTFPNGKIAHEFLIKNQDIPELFPDVMLVDINMPVMNGWEFLDTLVQENNPVLERSIVNVLTSSNNKQDREKFTQYPFLKDYILKPILPDQLKKSIENWRKQLRK